MLHHSESSSIELAVSKVPERESQPLDNNELLFVNLLKDAADRPKEVAKPAEKTDLQKAETEVEQTLERLQPQPFEPSLAKLSTSLAKAIINSDVKKLEQFLKDNKESELLPDAIEQVDKLLSDAGLLVEWDSEKEELRIIRPPSNFVKGPEGSMVAISASGAEAKSYAVENNLKPGFNVDPYLFKEKITGPVAGMKDLTSLAIKRLAADHDALQSIIEDVRKAGAFEHNGGFGENNAEKDMITPLAEAIFEKRLRPLVKAVQATTSDEERLKLAEGLHERLREAGMYADYTEEEGFIIGMYAYGVSDGYVIFIPNNKNEALSAQALRGPKHHDPEKPVPTVYRDLKGKTEINIDVAEAMRGLLRRAVDKNHLQRRP